MAFLNATNCNYIYVLCLIAIAWQLCVAKQLPLPANVAAAAAAAATTNSSGGSGGVGISSIGIGNSRSNIVGDSDASSGSSSNVGSSIAAHQSRHESYDAEADDDVPTSRRHRREVTDWFIAPNTRWCGRGNLANGTYNRLGGASLADKCCRKHDHCKISIPGMAKGYDIFNFRPYTLSHCSCDRRFRTCLKMANDEDAATIGKLYFNLVTQCFVVRTERVCQQHGNGKDAQCLKHLEHKKAYLKDNLKF